MLKHKKVFLFSVISLFVMLACNLTTPVNPENIPSSESSESQPQQQNDSVAVQGLCDNPLYPVKQNATWTYSGADELSGNYTYTDTITEVRSDGFTLSSQFDGLTRTQAWMCETGGLKAIDYGGGPTASISTQDMNATFNTLNVTGVSIPKEIISGMQWLYTLQFEGTITMPDTLEAPASGSFTAEMQEIGSETITVPAGTFETIKFQAVTTLNVQSEFQGIQIPVAVTGSTITWFAPGIGQVKSISNTDFGGQPFTTTIELQSYNIP